MWEISRTGQPCIFRGLSGLFHADGREFRLLYCKKRFVCDMITDSV